jgi:hypothetical protein
VVAKERTKSGIAGQRRLAHEIPFIKRVNLNAS